MAHKQRTVCTVASGGARQREMNELSLLELILKHTLPPHEIILLDITTHEVSWSPQIHVTEPPLAQLCWLFHTCQVSRATTSSSIPSSCSPKACSSPVADHPGSFQSITKIPSENTIFGITRRIVFFSIICFPLQPAPDHCES